MLGNDSDPDGDKLTVTAASSPNGTVSINPDGTLNFAPNPDFTGTAAITYTISDGRGGSSTATVILQVTAVVNRPPVAGGDGTQLTAKNVPLTGIAVLGNDSDPDGDKLTVTAATSPNGTVSINPDGTLNFVPNKDFTGTTTITYTISDGRGGVSTTTFKVLVAAATEIIPVQPAQPETTAPPLALVEQAREPSVFFDGAYFNGVLRLPIPFHPAVFVNRVVEMAQRERGTFDVRDYSDPEAVTPGDGLPVSLAGGLGADPALFVQPVVRAAQGDGAFIDNVIDGRYSRINLSIDWRITTPALSQPDGANLLRGTPVAGERGAAEIPPGERPATDTTGKPAGDTRSAPGNKRAAPSFSQQLRGGAGRLPLTGRQGR